MRCPADSPNERIARVRNLRRGIREDLCKYNGKIALDVRDTVSAWAAGLAPKAAEGAPNVLMLAWDLGDATMDTFGGPVECPNTARIAAAGVKFASFHTTGTPVPWS